MRLKTTASLMPKDDERERDGDCIASYTHLICIRKRPIRVCRSWDFFLASFVHLFTIGDFFWSDFLEEILCTLGFDSPYPRCDTYLNVWCLRWLGIKKGKVFKKFLCERAFIMLNDDARFEYSFIGERKCTHESRTPRRRFSLISKAFE